MMFLECPAFLDRERSVLCGLPAEAIRRFTMRSTDGPLESAMIRCPVGHHFSAPIESLIWDGQDNHDPGPALPGSRAGRGSHVGRDGNAESTVRAFPADPEPGFSRPAAAPAYYLGRPARVWITVMRSRRGATHPVNGCGPAPAAGTPAPSLKGGSVTGTETGTACVAPALASPPAMRAR